MTWRKCNGRRLQISCDTCLRSKARIDLLFTMSEIPHAHPVGQHMQSDVSRTNQIKQSSHSIEPSGGARRDRTDDLMLAKHALSQLSYGPVPEDERCSALIMMVGLGRLELPTSRLSSARSNQLSYKPLTREARMRASVCTRCIAQREPLARVRPRRKRNEDGEIPPMQLDDLAIAGH